MGPIVESLKTEYDGKVDVRVYNVGTDQAAYDVFTKLGGTGVPEFYFINTSGQLVDRIIGGAAEQDIKTKLDALN